MNNQYETLLITIGSFSDLDDSIQKESSALLAFREYLNQKKDDLSTFRKIAHELMDYLDNYDFAKGFSFNSVIERMDMMEPLRLKLDEMAEAAKELNAYPDDHDSMKTIDACLELYSFCQNNMSLDNIRQAFERVETGLQRLYVIRTLFEKDIKMLKAELLERKPDIWEEDTVILLATVEALLNGLDGVSLGVLKDRYSQAKLKRVSDIEETIKKYPWLEKNTQKNGAHMFWVSKHMLLKEYHLVIEGLYKSRKEERVAFWVASSIVAFFVAFFVWGVVFGNLK